MVLRRAALSPSGAQEAARISRAGARAARFNRIAPVPSAPATASATGSDLDSTHGAQCNVRRRGNPWRAKTCTAAPEAKRARASPTLSHAAGCLELEVPARPEEAEASSFATLDSPTPAATNRD